MILCVVTKSVVFLLCKSKGYTNAMVFHFEVVTYQAIMVTMNMELTLLGYWDSECGNKLQHFQGNLCLHHHIIRGWCDKLWGCTYYLCPQYARRVQLYVPGADIWQTLGAVSILYPMQTI